MIFVEPSCEIIRDEHTIEFALGNIERAARICYASEKNSKDNKEFLRSLYMKHHYRPFEFGTIYYTLYYDATFRSRVSSTTEWIEEDVSRSPWTHRETDYEVCYYTTNCRVILEKIESRFKTLDQEGVFNLFWETIHEIYDYRPDFHKDRDTILWKISRGIADEFRTHTQISSLMQSTRYCNYSSNKFDNQIRICRPQWMKLSANRLNKLQEQKERTDDSKSRLMIHSWCMSENAYKELINIGTPAEEARGVLPLDIYTEFIQCGFEKDWTNFFNQRYFGTTGKPHPDAQYIAGKAYCNWKGVVE